MNMKRNWTTRASLFLVAAILVVLNLISVNWFGRLDLTDDKAFSLAPASINMVQKLKDPVTIKVWFTDNLPAPYASNRRFLRDKLNEYCAYGGRKFQYQFSDTASEADKKAAEEAGIAPVQVQLVENDNLQVKSAYMGLTVEFGGKKEVLPVVQDLAGLEYELTSAIRKLTVPNLPKIGFLTGHGEPTPDQALRFWKAGLEKSYTTTEVRVDSTGQLSEKPDVLMIVAPRDSLKTAELAAIDDFIMGGGNVGFLLNAVDADIQSGIGVANRSGLVGLVRSYGVALQTNLVEDRQSAPITAQNGPFTVQIPYQFLPIATKFGEHTAVKGLREMLMPFVSSIDLAKTPQGIRATPLVYSSLHSHALTKNFMVRPDPKVTPNPNLSGGPYVLAAAFEGAFPSPYIPGKTSRLTRILVVGDGDFINENIVGQPPEDNLVFALNSLDWLLQDEALASIRGKSIEPRTLDPVQDGAKSWIKWFVILFPPLLVIVFGLFRWRMRKNVRMVVTETT